MSNGPHVDKTSSKGCGDHGCFVEKPTGMGTNGSCRCPAWKLQREIFRLRAQVTFLKGALKHLNSVECGEPEVSTDA
jgi:hypothetical protein